MKKIMKVVSLVLTFALLASMVIVPSSTAFGDDDTPFEVTGKGTITIQPQSSVEGANLQGAVFTAYRILAITDTTGGATDTYRLPFTNDENGQSADSNNYKIRQDLIACINAFHNNPAGSATDAKIPNDSNLQDILTHLRAHANGTEFEDMGQDPSNASMEKFADKFYKDYIQGTNKSIYEELDATSTYSSPNQQFVDLPYGYYLIYNTTPGTNYGATSAIILINNDVASDTIYIKATVPTLDKKIIEEVSSEGTTAINELTANSGSVGDTVKFQLKTILPNATGYADDTFKYTITDKLTKGLTLEPSSFTVSNLKITIGTAGDYHTLKAANNTDYASVSRNTIGSSDSVAPDGTLLTISLTKLAEAVADNATFPDSIWSDEEAYTPKVNDDIFIEYSAKINDKAVITPDTANTNNAQLEYSNNPGSDTTGKTEEDPGTTKTYTFGLKIDKQDSGKETTKVKGAKFTIRNSEGEYAQVTGSTGAAKPVTGGANTIGSWTSSKDDATYFVTDTNGNVQINGLGEGKYILQEMGNPDRGDGPQYYMITEEIEFTITPTFNKTSGALESLSYVLTEEYNGVRGSSTDKNFSAYGGNTSKTSGLAIIPVLNSLREPLPETGGMGTTMIYVVGGALIVIAGVLLISKRRMGATR